MKVRAIYSALTDINVYHGDEEHELLVLTGVLQLVHVPVPELLPTSVRIK